MPDVLAHVLVGYVVGTILATRLDRFDDLGPETVTVTMAGALAPDFVKVKILFPDPSVEAALGVPFSWGPLHAVSGVVVVALLAGLVVGREYRRPVIALVLLGAATHLFLDSLLIKPTGYALELFAPFSDFTFPAGGLYVSSDRWPTAVAASAAACTWAWRRYREPGPSAG